MLTAAKQIMQDPAAFRKFIVALIGAVGTAVSVGLLPAAVGGWVAVAVSFVTAMGVYRVYNSKGGNTNVQD